MNALAVSLLAFVIVFGGALLGMCVVLPESHLREDVKDVVRLSAGLIGTIAALVLGRVDKFDPVTSRGDE